MFSFLFNGKPQPPTTVPSDTIIPLNGNDDNYVNRCIVMLFMMRFDDVLDPEKLRSSLEKLLERKGWRKLGARLRLNSQGKLEYHVPEDYSPKRPAIVYTHVKHDVNIEDDPLASKLPKATSKPAIVGDSKDFEELMRRPDGPKSLDDYIYRDEPQLGLHIVSYNDTTLVSLNWMHTLFDAMGRRELLTAWTAMLEGREDDVKPFLGFDVNPMADLGSNPTEKYVLADKLVSMWGMAVFVFRSVWETFAYPREELRMVCMPAAHVKKLKSSVNQELSEQTHGLQQAFASEGDVLFAYVTRLFLQHLPKTSQQTIHMMNAFGLRSVLKGDCLPADKAYVGNAVSSVNTLLSAKDILTNPLSYTAWAIRKSIMEQGTREQVEARAALQKAVKMPMFGDATMQLVTMSNWAKANFFDTDFSAAVTTAGVGSKERPNRLGKPTLILGNTFVKGISIRQVASVTGKDADGNVWWGGTLREGLWGKIAETLERDF
ncbi:lysR family regulatory protein [Colletotrichum karsti]|uniref:LysR family regulatory protein n=1 Tax=Colletotrichum karsti TaxID=1095194 RepID=A0A9P6HXR3_9PEZI|nr:lysR family regulatory protein [Colletotrichum karsti]KAF9873177.1 lysR family regulatory protein [Colletotrichum karsti]